MRVAGYYNCDELSAAAGLADFISAPRRAIEIEPVGAALKYCELAAGRWDAAGSPEVVQELWDIAAAAIIIREAGGEIFDCRTKAPVSFELEGGTARQVLAVAGSSIFLGS